MDDIRQGLLRVIEIIEREKCHKGYEVGDEQAQVQRQFGRGIYSDWTAVLFGLSRLTWFVCRVLRLVSPGILLAGGVVFGVDCRGPGVILNRNSGPPRAAAGAGDKAAARGG